MSWLSPSRIVARLGRFIVYWPLQLHLWANRRAIVLWEWLEDDRPLDRPLPWLAGLILAVLLFWLVRAGHR